MPEVNPHALTPEELAYANSGGDTSALEKAGLLKQEPPPQQAAEPPLQQVESPPLQPTEPEEEDEPRLDEKTGRPKERGKWVSKKALDEERNERQRLSQELAGTKEQWARLEERFKVFQEALQAPEPEEPAEEPEEALPDPEQDIIGFNRKLAERMDRRWQQQQQYFAELNDRLNGYGQESQAQRAQNDLVSRYRADAGAFAQKQTDFADAYRFLIASRNAELEAAGYADPTERLRLITADEQALAARAFENRASPAERVYALAKARGYQQAASAPAAAIAPAPTNGAATATPKPQAQTASEEIAKLQAGQNAAMSLSNVGGKRTEALGIQDIIDMPMDEFRSWARKNPGLLEAMAGRDQ